MSYALFLMIADHRKTAAHEHISDLMASDVQILFKLWLNALCLLSLRLLLHVIAYHCTMIIIIINYNAHLFLALK
jgi:hypothetical protein